MIAELRSPPPKSHARECAWAVLECLSILAIFALVAGWPVPDVNETHYLLKAKHHWQPEFLQGDLFLESPEAHGTFYVLFGWLTVWMPLEAAAWCGRVLVWSCQAVAWQRLSWAVIPRKGLALITAAAYVTLIERFHMAGEWVVGGFESKGLAYALVFLGLAQLVRQRWNLGLALLGGATAMHALVGGWSLVASGVCWLWQGSNRPKVITLLPGLIVAFALSLTSVWPALVMDRGVDSAIVAQAHEIYVFQRLPHHLTPFGFKPLFIERHALLLCIWIALCAFTPRDDRQRVVRGFVDGAVLITLAGVVIAVVLQSQPQLAAGLLRFYWFRLGDAILPLGVALIGTSFLLSPQVATAKLRKVIAVLVAAGVLWHLGQAAIARVVPSAPRSDPPNKVIDATDWRAACLWIREHTPTDAVILGPRSAQTLKWHSLRREVGNWKDIPQNARDLVEWWQRMDTIHATHSLDPEDQWYDSLAEAGVDHALQMARKYDADYILTATEPPLALPRLYGNDSYTVYEVPKRP